MSTSDLTSVASGENEMGSPIIQDVEIVLASSSTASSSTDCAPIQGKATCTDASTVHSSRANRKRTGSPNASTNKRVRGTPKGSVGMTNTNGDRTMTNTAGGGSEMTGVNWWATELDRVLWKQGEDDFLAFHSLPPQPMIATLRDIDGYTFQRTSFYEWFRDLPIEASLDAALFCNSNRENRFTFLDFAEPVSDCCGFPQWCFCALFSFRYWHWQLSWWRVRAWNPVQNNNNNSDGRQSGNQSFGGHWSDDFRIINFVAECNFAASQPAIWQTQLRLFRIS